MIDGTSILSFIPPEVIANKNSQEMKIRFVNGSILQMGGSDSYDRLLGTNPYGIVYSEFSTSDPKSYQYLRPILSVSDGWALFISCVSPETLVISDQGLLRIKNVSTSRETYSDLNKQVYGVGGFHNAEQFYYGGKQKTLKIKLGSGYELECTPIHPIWNGKDWIKSQDLKIGDLVPIQYGQDIWGNGLDVSAYKYKNNHAHLKDVLWDYSEDDFLYFLGLVHADGSYDKNKVCVTNKKDPEIRDFLCGRGFVTRIDDMHHEYNSKELCGLLEYLDFKHGARNKSFPEKLFSCSKQQMKSFLQGLFDGDGCSASGVAKRGYVKFVTTCLDFIKDLQVILLNFGIVSSVRFEDKAPTKIVKVWSRIYNLEITGHFAHIFYRDIGFRLERKQRNWANIPVDCREESGNVYPIDLSKLEGYILSKNIITNKERISRRLIARINAKKPHHYLQELMNNKYFYSPIKEITESESEVFDFVIPDTHSFFSNGFLSHNTPRGRNHFYNLYNFALESPDWFAYKLTIEDTKHITVEQVKKEAKEDAAIEGIEGDISDEMILQEYYCDFNRGIEGSIYCKYIDKMNLNGQITYVPYQVGFPVNTSWDIGVSDATCIIWFQCIGTLVHIIECYSNTGQGLEHYAKVIHSKDYVYGHHFAPFDIAVKEWGSGQTRIEKAKELGIRFKTATRVSIEDGIEATRSAFSKIWIDEVKCKPLLKSLEAYRYEFDEKNKRYRDNPCHDWSSHYSDCMRYLAISIGRCRDGASPEDLDRRYNEAIYGTQKPGGFFSDGPSNY